jgi:molybdopterin/thiamine biosynthesis adenylyltransferase
MLSFPISSNPATETTMPDTIPQLNAAPAEVAGALRKVTSDTFEDELVFDPVSGTLQVRNAGSELAADAVPATAMVREGFFGEPPIPAAPLDGRLADVSSGSTEDELSFDPVTGTLQVRAPGELQPADAVPATQMVLEGFFSSAAIVDERQLRRRLESAGGATALALVSAVLRDGGDAVRFIVDAESAPSATPALLVIRRGPGALAEPSSDELAGAAHVQQVLAVLEDEGRLDLRAWRRVDAAWERMDVTLIPDAAQVFSRNRGILESGLLASKQVAIVGLGSGGATIAVELAKAGVGKFVLVDQDRLEVHNVGRHVCDLDDLGRRKTHAVRDRILARNPAAEIEILEGDVVANLARFRELARASDVLIGATDNNRSRRAVNRVALEVGRPAIFGRAFRRACGGDVIRVRPGEGPCYECLIAGRSSEEEVSHAGSAQATAYTDVPVRVEPGLALDVAPVALMCARLALQELVRGTGSSLEASEADLRGSLFLWVNRREHQFAQWKPMGFGVSGQAPFRWYAARTEQSSACPVCREDAFLDALERETQLTGGEA